MKLSSPIFKLRSQAKRIKNEESLTMAESLDRVAQSQGYSTWSLLMQKQRLPNSSSEFLDYLNPSDLVLICARPGMGKTSLALHLLRERVAQDTHKELKHYFYSLSESVDSLRKKLQVADSSQKPGRIPFEVDLSDDISVGYIISRLKGIPLENSLIVIDYLQVLDLNRSNPPVSEQLHELKEFLAETGGIGVILSQVNRRFEQGQGAPSLEMIHQPNEFDLKLFNKVVFFHREASEYPVRISMLKPHRKTWTRKSFGGDFVGKKL